MFSFREHFLDAFQQPFHRCATGMGLLVIMAFLLLPASVAFGQEAEPSAESFFEKAQSEMVAADEARMQGQLETALTHYRNSLDLHMRFSRRYPEWKPEIVGFRMAYCDNQLEALSRRMKETEPAGKAGVMDNASDIMPLPAGPARENTSAAPEASKIIAMAKLLLRSGETEKADNLLMGLVKTYPDDYRVRFLLGALRCQEGRYQDALYVLDALALDTPDAAEVQVALGVAQMGLDDFDAAAECFRTAMELDREMNEPLYNMARLVMLVSPSNVTEAAVFYRKYLELGGAADPTLNIAVTDLPRGGEQDVVFEK